MRVFEDRLVQIASVRVQQRDLPLDRFDHSRMAVTDQRNVVVAIEKCLPGFVVKILFPAADDVEGFVVTDAEIATQE